MTRILIQITFLFFSDTSVVVDMTISYTSDVANASKFGVFTSILIRWKGSVYKLVYKEMLAFMAVYFALNIFYRTILKNGKENEFYRNLFEGKVTKIQCMYFSISSVVEFQRWWVLKSKIFVQESTYSKDSF